MMRPILTIQPFRQTRIKAGLSQLNIPTPKTIRTVPRNPPPKLLEFYTNEKGQPHKLDGPARVYDDGSYEWWRNGKRHRIDELAWLHFDPWGDRVEKWYNNGVPHRGDGPGWIKYDKETGIIKDFGWWWRGTNFSSIDKWYDAQSARSKISEQKLVLLKLKYG